MAANSSTTLRSQPRSASQPVTKAAPRSRTDSPRSGRPAVRVHRQDRRTPAAPSRPRPDRRSWLRCQAASHRPRRHQHDQRLQCHGHVRQRQVHLGRQRINAGAEPQLQRRTRAAARWPPRIREGNCTQPNPSFGMPWQLYSPPMSARRHMQVGAGRENRQPRTASLRQPPGDPRRPPRACRRPSPHSRSA